MEKDFQSKLSFLEHQSGSMFTRGFGLSVDVCNFIACQFALESDFGTSKLAVLHSNLCGMKVPHRRYTVCIGSFNGFAVYKDWYECKSDYLLWIFYNRPHQNTLKFLDSFKLFLRDSGYCPEKGYIQRIELIYNQFFQTSKN